MTPALGLNTCWFLFTEPSLLRCLHSWLLLAQGSATVSPGPLYLLIPLQKSVLSSPCSRLSYNVTCSETPSLFPTLENPAPQSRCFVLVFFHSTGQYLKLSWLYVCLVLKLSLPSFQDPYPRILGEQSACTWCSPTRHRLCQSVDEGLSDHL